MSEEKLKKKVDEATIADEGARMTAEELKRIANSASSEANLPTVNQWYGVDYRDKFKQ